MFIVGVRLLDMEIVGKMFINQFFYFKVVFDDKYRLVMFGGVEGNWVRFFGIDYIRSLRLNQEYLEGDEVGVQISKGEYFVNFFIRLQSFSYILVVFFSIVRNFVQSFFQWRFVVGFIYVNFTRFKCFGIIFGTFRDYYKFNNFYR